MTGGSEFVLHVSPEELHALDEHITALLLQYRDRITDPSLRPAGSLPVELLLFAYPIRPPEEPEPEEPEPEEPEPPADHKG